MFNSAEPRREGFKDGWSGCPKNRGFYDEIDWANYLLGYEEGEAHKKGRTDPYNNDPDGLDGPEQDGDDFD